MNLISELFYERHGFPSSYETRPLSKRVEQHEVRAGMSNRRGLRRRNEMLQQRLRCVLPRASCAGCSSNIPKAGHCATGWGGTSLDQATGRAEGQRSGGWLRDIDVRGPRKSKTIRYVEKGHDAGEIFYKLFFEKLRIDN